MTLETPPASDASLVARIKGVLTQPKLEWERIDREPATVQSLFVPYVLILAAIGPIAALIGGQLFALNFMGVSFRPPLIAGVVTAALSYGLSIVGVFVLSLIIDGLAPSFGGVKNRVQSTKVAVYSSTATWLAGIFGLLPAIAAIGGLLGLYSLYLLYLGLPVLTKAPKEKAVTYTIVVVIAAIVVWLVIGAIVAAVSTSLLAGAMGTAAVFGGL
jgi:hypothetical protein